MVPLLEVAPLGKSRVTRWEGLRPYVATGDVDDMEGLDPSPIDFQSRPSRADLVAAPGDVAFARMAATSKVFQVTAERSEFVYSTGFAIVSPVEGVLDSGYLTHWLRSREFQSAKDLHSAGATQRAITNGGLSKMVVPLPPLESQRRIAAILDRADALRAKRRQVLAHADALTQSIFYDMFGHPLVNRHELPRASIGSIASVMTGNSPSRADAANFGDDIEWIKSDNLGGPVATRSEESLSQVGRARARIAPEGSVLVTCIAGSPTSIGKASLVDREVAFNQQINAVLPSPDLDSTFLLGQLKAAPELVRAKSTGGMKGLVNKSAFRAIEILVPPLDLQRAFASRVKKAGAQRAAVERAMKLHDVLFVAIESRAF